MTKSLRSLATSVTLALAAFALTSCGNWCGFGNGWGGDNCCDPCPQRCCRAQNTCCDYNNGCNCCPQPAWCGDQPWDYCNPTAYRLRY
ncbi:MAG: hypothetical protein Q8K75_02455 [Chlamydiales bacterium]|nr:hypothetical protein [Chlamydiales bacterium]